MSLAGNSVYADFPKKCTAVFRAKRGLWLKKMLIMCNAYFLLFTNCEEVGDSGEGGELGQPSLVEEAGEVGDAAVDGLVHVHVADTVPSR